MKNGGAPAVNLCESQLAESRSNQTHRAYGSPHRPNNHWLNWSVNLYIKQQFENYYAFIWGQDIWRKVYFNTYSLEKWNYIFFNSKGVPIIQPVDS